MTLDESSLSTKDRFKNLICDFRSAWLALFGGAIVFLVLSLLTLLFISGQTGSYYVSIFNVGVCLFLIANSGTIIYLCDNRSEEESAVSD